jgi:hypothetical protein
MYGTELPSYRLLANPIASRFDDLRHRRVLPFPEAAGWMKALIVCPS